MRLVGRARARLDEVVSVELVVLHSVGPVHVAVVVVVVVVVSSKVKFIPPSQVT